MIARLIVQTLGWIAIMGAVLFGSAGTVRWPAAWVFLSEMAVLGIGVGLWLAQRDPVLLAQRLASPIQRDQKSWDKVFMATLLVAFCAWFILMGLDAVRYKWSSVPMWLQVAGAICLALSIYISVLTFRENTYAVPVIRVQEGQNVITSGPYSYVRHPLYAGAILFFLGVPLLLGSWWGLAAVPLLIAPLAFRVVMEERTLSSELEGYAEYATKVRYRLIPGVW